MFNNIINRVYEFFILKNINPRNYPVFEVNNWPVNSLVVIFEISMLNNIKNLVYKFFILTLWAGIDSWESMEKSIAKPGSTYKSRWKKKCFRWDRLLRVDDPKTLSHGIDSWESINFPIEITWAMLIEWGSTKVKLKFHFHRRLTSQNLKNLIFIIFSVLSKLLAKKFKSPIKNCERSIGRKFDPTFDLLSSPC